MSKILALAEEIDKEFRSQEEQIKNLINHAEAMEEQLHDQNEQTRILRGRADYLENELNNEKTKNSEFRKDLMQVLLKYSSDEWSNW